MLFHMLHHLTVLFPAAYIAALPKYLDSVRVGRDFEQLSDSLLSMAVLTLHSALETLGSNATETSSKSISSISTTSVVPGRICPGCECVSCHASFSLELDLGIDPRAQCTLSLDLCAHVMDLAGLVVDACTSRTQNSATGTEVCRVFGDVI